MTQMNRQDIYLKCFTFGYKVCCINLDWHTTDFSDGQISSTNKIKRMVKTINNDMFSANVKYFGANI